MAEPAPTPASADRNLLFGVLALQADLLDNDRFAEACSAWAARKETPLADLLVQRGWLTPEERGHVEFLLDRKLKKHLGDAHASLAEVTTDPVRQSLAGLDDAAVRQSLAGLATPPAGPVLPGTTAYVPESRGRYTLTRLHATGGIGRVWLARDNTLGRDVALKELRPERAGQPTVAARFLREARVTGQLEHPGIVPIYELGRRPDGQQPFYTMRFVRGRTLAEAAAAYHRRREANAAGPLELRELLTAFVGVCNTVAYSHSRGILHRDLKPQNVVLGDYGEVIVLDWGLAKVVGEAEGDAALDRPPVALQGEGSRDETVAGQVLGTPAYMAPEQAEGRIDLIDRRTDVYGLGAILFEILTGKPPHTGAGTEELLRHIAQGGTPPARSTGPTVPRALEAVCARAMARSRDARYESAATLAGDVLRWLGDEPVTAYPEPLRVRAWRKLRRYKGLVAAAAVVLVSVSTVSSVLALQIYREKTNVEKAEQVAVQEKLKAEEAEKVAVAQSHLAIDALGNMVLEVQNELEDAPGAFPVRKAILTETMALLKRLADTPATSDRVIRRHLLAHMQVGDIAWALADRDKAHQEYLTSLKLAERAFEMNPASDKAKGNLAAMHNKVGESEQFHRRRFDEARRHYESAAKAWAELTEKMRKLPDGDPSLDKEERLDLPETERALADAYDHVAKIHYAEEDVARRDPAKAEEYLKKSLVIRQRYFAASPSRENRYRLAVSHQYLADLAMKRNDIAGTVAHNEESLKHRQAILKDHPTSLKAKRDVGDAQLRLGDVTWYAGQHERAYALYKDSLKWNEQVMWSEPDSPHYRGRVCQSHYCVGCGALKARDKNLALHHFQEALKIREATYREHKEKKILDVPTRTTLMLTLARCGEHRRAVELAEEVRPLADARVLAEEVGTAYGICMAAVQGDRTSDQLPSEERELRDRYRDLAVAAVKAGAAKGYANLLFLEGDPDMEPLLALPEFRAWLAEFKKGIKRK
jgi:tetratricopeptide (TPR) repeat protein/tRNA A-37 threonylcarbamoyl transferase component Bud32